MCLKIVLLIVLFLFCFKISHSENFTSFTTARFVNTQVCPNGCVCAVSKIDTTILESISCTCKNEVDNLPTVPSSSSERVTIPLGGDYTDIDDDDDDDDDNDENERDMMAHSSLSSSHLVLEAGSFVMDGARILRIVVHACERVTISKWAFRNAKIVDQIKFANIDHLEFQPHSFGEMRGTPAQIVVEHSALNRIPARAFSDLKDLEHFWWRNVSINRIEKLAFFKLSNVGYIYFRDTSIGLIENGAFAHIRNVRHFFMRRNIRLGRVEDFILLGARIDEIIFEDVKMNSSIYAFNGLKSSQINFQNCVWSTINAKARVPHPKHQPRQNIGEFYATNLTIDYIVLANFYNVSIIIFEDSQIDVLKAGFFQPVLAIDYEASNKSIPLNVDQITFSRCRIMRWLSYALNNVHSVGTITIQDSRLLFIARNAIFGSHIAQLSISRTRIKSFGVHAISQSNFVHLQLEDLQVGVLRDAAFYRSCILELLFRNVVFQVIEARALADIRNCNNCEIARCKFADSPTKMFENSNMTKLYIRESTFNGIFDAEMFAKLNAYFLHVANCRFQCASDACENNALLLRGTVHDNLAWMFTNNICVNPEQKNLQNRASENLEIALLASTEANGKDSTNQLKLYQSDELFTHSKDICIREFETMSELANNGLVCRRRALIEECVCVKTPESSSIFALCISNGPPTFADATFVHFSTLTNLLTLIQNLIPYPLLFKSVRSSQLTRIPDTTAKILLIGDCERLLVERSSSVKFEYSTRERQNMQENRPNLAFLYLYRINELFIDANFDAMLRHVNILYSNVNIIEQAVNVSRKNEGREAAQLDDLSITGSMLNGIGAFAFSRVSKINTFVLNRTIIRGVDANAFAQSHIDRVELWQSDAHDIGDMLERVNELRVEQSRIPHARKSFESAKTNMLGSELNWDHARTYFNNQSDNDQRNINKNYYARNGKIEAPNLVGPYELCVLRSANTPEQRHLCQRCVKQPRSCAEFFNGASNAAAAQASIIIKRCTADSDTRCYETVGDVDVNQVHLSVLSESSSPASNSLHYLNILIQITSIFAIKFLCCFSLFL